MSSEPVAVAPTIEIESQLLAVLLSAESARDGVMSLLEALRPSLDDATAAIAVRDRDGVTLHVLAETGAPQRWPEKLPPQIALGAQPGVDPATSTLIAPLRADGRVVGALVFGDAVRGTELLREPHVPRILETVAAVLHALASRTDAELGRRASELRSLDAIVEGMAHQMANPLTGASAIAQLLAEDLRDEGHRAAVQQIRQEMARAFAVLNDLLEFQRDSRAHDGILDLNVVVDRLMRFRGYAIREQGITLDVDVRPDFLPVRADVRGLEHAMLIALRHAELQSSGTVNRNIRVRVAERGPAELSIEITDSGPGSVPELAASFFDMPYRVEHPARSSFVETPDLGLADSILRGCGGRLAVSASKADGTTLSLVLPRASTSPPPAQHKSKP